jgi:poly-D-alanine transfer protein DltD
MGSLSADQYYELAPPEVKEVIKQSHKVFNERKTELIEQLVANCADDDLKKTMTENFAAKSIDELELLSQAFGKPAVSDNPFRANYSGRSVGVSNTAAEMSKKDREDFLPVPVMNFSTEEDAA